MLLMLLLNKTKRESTQAENILAAINSLKRSTGDVIEY
jgi:hypothetical protein